MRTFVSLPIMVMVIFASLLFCQTGVADDLDNYGMDGKSALEGKANILESIYGPNWDDLHAQWHEMLGHALGWCGGVPEDFRCPAALTHKHCTTHSHPHDRTMGQMYISLWDDDGGLRFGDDFICFVDMVKLAEAFASEEWSDAKGFQGRWRVRVEYCDERDVCENSECRRRVKRIPVKLEYVWTAHWVTDLREKLRYQRTSVKDTGAGAGGGLSLDGQIEGSADLLEEDAKSLDASGQGDILIDLKGIIRKCSIEVERREVELGPYLVWRPHPHPNVMKRVRCPVVKLQKATEAPSPRHKEKTEEDKKTAYNVDYVPPGIACTTVTMKEGYRAKIYNPTSGEVTVRTRDDGEKTIQPGGCIELGKGSFPVTLMGAGLGIAGAYAIFCESEDKSEKEHTARGKLEKSLIKKQPLERPRVGLGTITDTIGLYPGSDKTQGAGTSLLSFRGTALEPDTHLRLLIRDKGGQETAYCSNLVGEVFGPRGEPLERVVTFSWIENIQDITEAEVQVVRNDNGQVVASQKVRCCDAGIRVDAPKRIDRNVPFVVTVDCSTYVERAMRECYQFDPRKLKLNIRSCPSGLQHPLCIPFPLSGTGKFEAVATGGSGSTFVIYVEIAPREQSRDGK